MKSKNLKKLSLNKTTISELTIVGLSEINGGRTAADPTGVVLCPTGDCTGGDGLSNRVVCSDVSICP